MKLPSSGAPSPGAPHPAEAGLRIASFRFDVTPPLGHSLCGGWIKPAIAHDDPLEAIGYVLWGVDGPPVVVCAVDWTALLNEAHLAWRQALAEAAGTTPDRVAVHCVHQHNAPFVCLDARALAARYPDLPPMFDLEFFQTCLARARAAVRGALSQARPVTHVGHGQARVERVASNRRMARTADGTVVAIRRSSCTDPELVAMPEGLIDPWLKTVAFFEGETKLVSCHYYATHPMSYYEDGRVTTDFCGLARRRRQADEPGCTHLYFTGCAGNLSAGKYNDGSPEARRVLTERMYAAIVASEASLQRAPVTSVEWRTAALLPPPSPQLVAADLEAAIADSSRPLVERLLPAFKLAWLRRHARGLPIALGALRLNDVAMLHLPAELFVEYQLRAQALRPDLFVAVAGYGDDGPWYVPIEDEYSKGGYEVSVAFCAPEVDALLTRRIAQLLA